MDTVPYGESGTRSVIASGEGYLALALVVLGFLVPGGHHSSNDTTVGAAVCIGIAFGLAVGGVRFGKGGGRLAARVALGGLSFWLFLVLETSSARWEEILWYWRH